LLLCCLCCCLFCCWWRRRKQNWHEFDDVEMPEKKALKQRANPEALDILQQQASKSRAYDDPVAPLPAVHSSFGDEGADAEASSGEFTVGMMQMHQPPPVMAEVSREREVEYSELSFTVATNDEEVPYVPALLEGVLLQRVADRMDIDINAVKMGATRVSLVRKDVGTAKVLVDKEVYDNVSNEITKDDNLDCLPPGCSEMWTVRLAKKPNRSPEVLTFNVSTGQDGMAVDKDTFLDRFLPRLAQELQVPVDGLSVAGVKGSLLRRDLVQVKVQVDGRWVVRGVRSTVDRAEFLAATQVFDDLLPGYTVTFSSGKAKQAKQAKQLVSQLRSSME